MPTQPRPRPAHRSVQIVAAAAFAAAAVTSTAAMPTASASPQGDLYGLVNNQHVAFGCHPYGGAGALSDVALQLAKGMANNSGRKGPPGTFQPTTEQLLNGRGYTAHGVAEMDYFVTRGGSAQAAFNFWMANGTRAAISDCGLAQMETAVWIVNNNFAAVTIMANP